MADGSGPGRPCECEALPRLTPRYDKVEGVDTDFADPSGITAGVIVSYGRPAVGGRPSDLWASRILRDFCR
jgi:hypothetical protein